MRDACSTAEEIGSNAAPTYSPGTHVFVDGNTYSYNAAVTIDFVAWLILLGIFFSKHLHEIRMYQQCIGVSYFPELAVTKKKRRRGAPLGEVCPHPRQYNRAVSAIASVGQVLRRLFASATNKDQGLETPTARHINQLRNTKLMQS